MAFTENLMVWLRNLGLLALWISLLRATDHGRRAWRWMTDAVGAGQTVEIER
jgi:hypothetical protein